VNITHGLILELATDVSNFYLSIETFRTFNLYIHFFKTICSSNNWLKSTTNLNWLCLLFRRAVVQ